MEQALIDGIWKVLVPIVAFLLIKYVDHEKRIQRQEDVTFKDVKELKQDLKDFKKEMSDFQKEIAEKIDALTNMVHKDKNMENQLNSTLSLLLKELQKKN